MDEVIISKAITESYVKDLLEVMDVDVAVVGAGPSGVAAGYYLAKAGIKTVIFEKKLSIGGGMWGGGMLLSGSRAAELAVDILKGGSDA